MLYQYIIAYFRYSQQLENKLEVPSESRKLAKQF